MGSPSLLPEQPADQNLATALKQSK